MYYRKCRNDDPFKSDILVFRVGHRSKVFILKSKQGNKPMTENQRLCLPCYEFDIFFHSLFLFDLLLVSILITKFWALDSYQPMM